METLESHFHNWFGVIFFIVLYGVVCCSSHFIKKWTQSPAGLYRIHRRLRA
jgi:hypothetical protein